MTYLAQRIAEIRAHIPPADRPTVSEMREVNARFHYARLKYRSAFDLWWRPGPRAIVLRIAHGRRVLPVPSDAVRVGRYDRASEWADVKADLLATIGGGSA